MIETMKSLDIIGLRVIFVRYPEFDYCHCFMPLFIDSWLEMESWTDHKVMED